MQAGRVKVSRKCSHFEQIGELRMVLLASGMHTTFEHTEHYDVSWRQHVNNTTLCK